MRNRVYLALTLSVILIGTAFWMRLGKNSPDKAELSVVSTETYSDLLSQDLLSDSLSIATTTPAVIHPLNGTDYVGRQLVADYVNMATNGQSSGVGIDSLAGKYVENIPALLSIERFEYTDLKITASNKDNLRKYSSELVAIQKTYGETGMSLSSNVSELSKGGKVYYEYAGKMSSVYKQTAEKLKLISVPTILAEKHGDLINAYLASASAMTALANTESDPATAFAGLVILDQNLERETLALQAIGKILTTNGV